MWTKKGSFRFSGMLFSALGRIVMAGLIDNNPGLLNQPMRVFGHYGVVYLLDGRGLYFDENGYEQEVAQGDLMFLFPDVAHSYGPRSGEFWNEFYIGFDGPIFDLWRDLGLLDSNRPIHHLEPVNVWLQKLQDAVPMERPQSEAENTVEISRFATLLAEMLQQRDSLAPHDWMPRARQMLESNLGGKIKSEDVARQLHLSHETFRKKFAHETGVSPMRYRAQKRIEAACALLMHTSLPHYEIARTVGFSDEFQFSRRFKEMTGTTPREFRREQAGRK
jgi:AraC-like DNA-binding protein